jgi:sterol desaturase/sphingolipid hydroxylase (fatty acid hydroxylase superfamily)
MFRLLLLIAGCALLSALESIAPLYRFPDRRLRRALPNIGLTILLVATNLALASATALVCARFARHDLPPWLQLLAGIVALDFFAYLAHVAMHRTSAGWRFHRVHHSEVEVNVTTAFRQHPGESIWRILAQLPPILLLGLPLDVVAIWLALSALNAQLEHANIRIPARLDALARLVVVTPDMHKVHHSREQRETDSNYANIFSVWDRVFGTYTRRTDFATLRYGLDGFDDAGKRLGRLLAIPFE